MTHPVSPGRPARLLAVRLHGFKSFAERTVVEFGPGINAVVGPNGSGKSNLADALRWTLGEQGRSLRARRSEDVVWAGSERRAAIGMADVTITLDNADGLLPLDYEVVELGRRLYRSGENEYLLNRTRVRLRDLVELLDAAHLADNAFLFIGQGMVDQALALRPEERRPLFEEVAGVRRHERRRRRAEEQLADAEANLARVRDVLGELRPQARRLAAQAEQQAARRTVADDLADTVLGSAHHRWYEAATRVRDAGAAHRTAREAVDQALADLGGIEAELEAAAAELSGVAGAEELLLAELDGAVARLTDARLEVGRLEAESTALARDADRVRIAIASADQELAEARRMSAEAVPDRDPVLETELSAADRALAEALAELAAAQADAAAGEVASTAARRAAAARLADLEHARRVAGETRRQANTAAQAAAEAMRQAGAADARWQTTRGELEAADAELAAAVAARLTTRRDLEGADAAANRAATTLADIDRELAVATARAEALAATDAEPDDGGWVPAGSRRLGDGVEVEQGWQAPVDAALGEALPGFVLERRVLAAAADARGIALVRDEPAGPGRDHDADAAFRDRLAALGGGLLADAIRRDEHGVARRLLARVGWLPDRAAALELQPELPIGWVVVTRDGSGVIGPVVVRFQAQRGRLERRAERERLERAAAGLRGRLGTATTTLRAAEAALAAARAAEEQAREVEAKAGVTRQRLIEQERAAGRAAEVLHREAAWSEAQSARSEREADRASADLAALETTAPADEPAGAASATRDDAIATLESRARELRAARDRLGSEMATVDSSRRMAEARRATATATAELAERRAAQLSDELALVTSSLAEIGGRREQAAGGLADAAAVERETRGRLDELRAVSAGGRARLAAAETAAVAARERVRRTEDALRAAEIADVEARLSLEGVREGLLVEIASLGEFGVTRLAAVGGLEPLAVDPEDASAAIEAALAAAAVRWAAERPDDERPSAARLAQLRRRFHELGATNPFAEDEYAEVRDRLANLETQDADLREAIEATRRLIGELNGLIADQFRTTFAALQDAFDRRFRQLFGGGYARLELTEPDDLSATGIEIVARPPGKKPQTLAMLSGGERALTAVGLLFAMLEVRPVPFCVLDEVDAALDEANIGRFTDALVDLGRQTQFVVITHNRGTIEVATALYGVTVDDDSVSRVISLRLDEATALAAEGRSTPAEPVGSDAVSVG